MTNKKKKLLKSKSYCKKPRRCNKCSVRRLCNSTSTGNVSGSKMMSKSPRIPEVKCPYRNIGLSSKEKSYLICKCQTKSARYVWLKARALDAIKEKKIFRIYGICNVVRKELVDRGWVEKYPNNKMNLTNIKKCTWKSESQVEDELEKILLSNLVSKVPPYFIWHTGSYDYTNRKIERAQDGTTIENKLTTDPMWANKQGLCSSMKRNYWFYVEDVSEVTAPRTYNTYDSSEIEDFNKDFKITACTSLLKWVLSMVANQQPVFSNMGQVSTNVLVFALNRCKEYLFRKQNKDIDRRFNNITEGQWKIFLKYYYTLIDRKEVFLIDVEECKLRLYLGYTKFLLKEICRYRPQLNCEGCHNIWIIKPPHNCRGRGIRMASKLGDIAEIIQKANKTKYVLQKYIEEPLLIYDTKFDIRQYYLVTSTYPLVIWMYEECYLKFSSQNYNINDFHESIHLTNNAVQKKYKNCANRHAELPEENMWDLNTYKAYLRSIGQYKTWNHIIYPGMRKAIISIMLSCQDSVTVNKNRFELYGCDFILDKTYTPWLIEINSCPDLNSTTSITGKICPAVLSDIIKVIIDYKIDENLTTGSFECIYHQPMTIPRYGPAVDLCVRGYSLPNNYFYRGVVPQASCDNDNAADKEIIDNSLDVLQKIRGYYRTPTTIYSDGDSDGESAYNVVTKRTGTSNVEELMDKMTSEGDKNLSQTQSTSSVIKVETVLKESLTQMASAVRDMSNNELRVTADDDNANKRHESNFIKDIIKNHELRLRESIQPPKFYILDSMEQASQSPDSKSIIMEATSDIVKFINKKEAEYNLNYVNLALNKMFD